MLAFPLLSLTLALKIAIVALIRPPCRRLLRFLLKSIKIHRSARSTAHANVAKARCHRGHNATVGTIPPLSGQCGLWCRPLGISAAYAWKVASLTHMGIMHSRCEGSFSSAPSPRFLMVDLPPRAQRCWRAVHDSTRPTTTTRRRDTRLQEDRSDSDESTVGKRQCRSNAELRGRINRV
jgi:hypothetical protein